MYTDRDYEQPWLKYVEREARPSAIPDPCYTDPPSSDDRPPAEPPPRGLADDCWP